MMMDTCVAEWIFLPLEHCPSGVGCKFLFNSDLMANDYCTCTCKLSVYLRVMNEIVYLVVCLMFS